MPGRFRDRWNDCIARAGAPLCVGLDPDPALLPCGVSLRAFLGEIIEATRDLVAAYKPNLAFFEAYGSEGWETLESLRGIVGRDVLLIADGKRGDVEHTNEAYARALFGRVQADAVTVHPYTGGRPLEPFFRDPACGIFVLCATSNPGAEEIQELDVHGEPLYLHIARKARTWSPHNNVGLVLGTTKPDALTNVLNVASDLPLLLPGGGAQGGNTAAVSTLLRSKGASGLFNFSRSVLYASSAPDFASAARKECERLREGMRAEG